MFHRSNCIELSDSRVLSGSASEQMHMRDGQIKMLLWQKKY